MKVEAVSAPDAFLKTAPLLRVGEISHRVLNEYTHAIAMRAVPRTPADPTTLD